MHLSKFGFTTASCVFRIGFGGSSSSPHSFLLRYNVIFALYQFLLALFVPLMSLLLLSIDLNFVICGFNGSFSFHTFLCLALNLNNTQISPCSSFKHKKVLFSFCTVGVINNQTSWKSWLHGWTCDHLKLLLSIRIKLKHCSASNT